MEIKSPLHLSFEALAEGLTRCFQGYFMPANFTSQMVAGMVRIENVDLANSLVAEEDGEIIGAALVARRGPVARVAAMAISTPWRGKGIGKNFMNRIIQDARNRGEARLVLEVITENHPAIALYESSGLKKEHSLLGFQIPLDSVEAAGSLEDVTLQEVAQVVRQRGEGAASWSMSAANIEQLTNPNRGVRAGEVYAVVGLAGESKVACRSVGFINEPSAQAASAWLSAMANAYPGSELHLPAFFPEPEFAEALTGAGMKVDELRQFQMARAL